MSLTIEKVIIDAKRLADRLKDRDTLADKLLNVTHQINKKIDAMKQYQEEVEILNEVAHQTPHSELIANIQKENRHLREIQLENRELRTALEEHQIALEHIMTKYRQHTNDQVYKSAVNFRSIQHEQYQDVIQRQVEKINEMAAIISHAAYDMPDYADESLFTALKYENKGLRELLNISCKYGSFVCTKCLTEPPSTLDKTVQTDQP